MAQLTSKEKEQEKENALNEFKNRQSIDYEEQAKDTATKIAALIRANPDTFKIDNPNREEIEHQPLIDMINRTLQGAMYVERYHIAKIMLANLLHVLSLLNNEQITPYATALFTTISKYQFYIDKEFDSIDERLNTASNELDQGFLDPKKEYTQSADVKSTHSGGRGKRTKYRRKNTRKSKRRHGKSNKRSGKSNKRQRGKSKRRR
jgi:hypothetical protein